MDAKSLGKAPLLESRQFGLFLRDYRLSEPLGILSLAPSEFSELFQGS